MSIAITARKVLETVADHLAANPNEAELEMSTFGPACGSSACIIGWAVKLIPGLGPTEADYTVADVIKAPDKNQYAFTEACVRLSDAFYSSRPGIDNHRLYQICFSWSTERAIRYLDNREWLTDPYMGTDLDEEVEL